MVPAARPPADLEGFAQKVRKLSGKLQVFLIRMTSLTSPIKPSVSSRCLMYFDVLPSLPGAGSFRMPAPEHRNSIELLDGGARRSQWFPPGRRSRGLYMFRLSSAAASQVTIGLFPWQKILKETLEIFSSTTRKTTCLLDEKINPFPHYWLPMSSEQDPCSFLR